MHRKSFTENESVKDCLLRIFIIFRIFNFFTSIFPNFLEYFSKKKKREKRIFCMHRKLFTENGSVKDCMLRMSSERTAPEGLILNFCVQTSPNFCTKISLFPSTSLETFQKRMYMLCLKRLTQQISWHISESDLCWKESMNNWLWIKWKEPQGAKSSEAPFLQSCKMTLIQH